MIYLLFDIFDDNDWIDLIDGYLPIYSLPQPAIIRIIDINIIISLSYFFYFEYWFRHIARYFRAEFFDIPSICATPCETTKTFISIATWCDFVMSRWFIITAINNREADMMTFRSCQDNFILPAFLPLRKISFWWWYGWFMLPLKADIIFHLMIINKSAMAYWLAWICALFSLPFSI